MGDYQRQTVALGWRDVPTRKLAASGDKKRELSRTDLVVNFPNNSPRLEHAIDPYANHNPDHYLGFGYDDVPYNHVEPAIS